VNVAGRDWLGTIMGLVTFLGGVALLVITFNFAYAMFKIPPAEMLGLNPGQVLQVNTVGAAVLGLLVRVLLLFVMAFVGSMIANRGILLLGHSRPRHYRRDSNSTEA